MRKIFGLLMLFIWHFDSSAQVKISSMPNVIGNGSGAYAPVVQAGVNRKMTVNQIANLFPGVKISDSSAMLIAYQIAISLKMDLSDTTAMLSAYRIMLDAKVDKSTTITINGVTFDLSQPRSFTVAGSGGVSWPTALATADSLVNKKLRDSLRRAKGTVHILIRDTLRPGDTDSTKAVYAIGFVDNIRKNPADTNIVQQSIDGVYQNILDFSRIKTNSDQIAAAVVRQDSAATAIATKQPTLIPGTNIANINGQPLVGGATNIVVNGQVHTDVIPNFSNNKFIVVAAGVVRGTVTLGCSSCAIAWAFIDSVTSHDRTFFDSVNATGNSLNIYYPPLKKPIYFGANPDETYAAKGIVVGASYGNTVANIYAYYAYMKNGELVGNGTTSPTVLNLATPVTNSFNTGDGSWSFTPNAGEYLSYRDLARGYGLQYIGNHNYYIRNPTGSTGGAMVKFYLVDNSSGADIITAPDATDRVLVTSQKVSWQAIPMQTTASNGAGSDIHTATANFWLHMIGERFIIASPSDVNQMLVEWQWHKSGSATYATNYRITRATTTAPGTETTIYNGLATNRNADGTWSFTDTGVTTGTKYIYRYYATISAVETLYSWVTAGAK